VKPAAPLVFLAGILLAGCRETQVDVVTEVGLSGGGIRTVTVTSTDEGAPADHPDDFRARMPGYTLLDDEPGLTILQASFPRLDGAPLGFGFSAPGSERTSGGAVRLAIQDWVLFKLYRYQESVSDAVDPDEVQNAIQELADTLVASADAAAEDLFGEDFDASRLHKGLQGNLRRFFRSAAFLIWRELQSGGEFDEAGILGRLLALARKEKLPAKREWIGLIRNSEDPRLLADVRREISLWVEENLQPVREGDRTPVLPNLEGLLFGGPFEQSFLKVLDRRFGGAEETSAWLDDIWKRVFGAFGPARKDLTFRMRVKMPGSLLRSNGFLGRQGSTFLEFPAGEAYPNGRGIACESVVWDYGALGVLRPDLAADNESALTWTGVVAEGPDSAPSSALVEVLRACVRANSLEPLREAADGGGHGAESARKTRAVLDWLEGGGD